MNIKKQAIDAIENLLNSEISKLQSNLNQRKYEINRLSNLQKLDKKKTSANSH